MSGGVRIQHLRRRQTFVTNVVEISNSSMRKNWHSTFLMHATVTFTFGAAEKIVNGFRITSRTCEPNDCLFAGHVIRVDQAW